MIVHWVGELPIHDMEALLLCTYLVAWKDLTLEINTGKDENKPPRQYRLGDGVRLTEEDGTRYEP